MKLDIISIDDHPNDLNQFIDFFANNWDIDRRIYNDCITNSLADNKKIPMWYLLLKNDEIIGGYGLISNDFNSRQDLTPWLCALFIKESERGHKFGEKLLEHARLEAKKLGYQNLYLCTNHNGYYEKYGWKHISNCYHPWGSESKVYKISTI